MGRGLVLLALLVGCTEPAPLGCPDVPASAEPLEIGVRGDSGLFEPLADGDPLLFMLGSQGNPMVFPCLRARGIEPRGPQRDLCVEVGGRAVGFPNAGERVDLPFDGTGNVLWDLRTVLVVEACCANCQTATVVATMRDTRGRLYAGSVDVVLGRGTCPDPVGSCCSAADTCPPPLITNVCSAE